MISTLTIRKWYLLRIIILASIAFATSDAYAQNRADQLALKADARAAGFSDIFFAKATFERVLQGADRVRFANGVTAADRRNAVLMVIGLDANGNEIGDSYLQGDINNVPSLIDRATRDSQVAAAQAHSRITAFTSEFEAASLSQMLANPGSTGITFFPITITGADGTEILTLSTVAATSSFNTMQLEPMAAPCPPDCGDQ